MFYLHTMVRITDVKKSLNFYCDLLGLKLIKKTDSEKGRYTNYFLCAPDDEAKYNQNQSPALELTHNWEPEEYNGGRNFGHLAYRVKNIYSFCEHLMENGIEINRPPRDGYMAFIKSPDGISIEILQDGQPLEQKEPWSSMPNIGEW